MGLSRLFTVLLIVLEVTSIDRKLFLTSARHSYRFVELTEAILYVILVGAGILSAVRPLFSTFSMFQVIFVEACVGVTTSKALARRLCVCTLAVSQVVFETSGVGSASRPLLPTSAVLFATLERASVDGSISLGFRTFTLLDVVPEVSLVA